MWFKLIWQLCTHIFLDWVDMLNFEIKVCISILLIYKAKKQKCKEKTKLSLSCLRPSYLLKTQKNGWT